MSSRREQIRERLRRQCANKQGDLQICLTMIVRNEEKNMQRLLDSVKPAIDLISIVDTGSTDSTVSVIEKWGKENAIPTTIHHQPFKNFAYNRTSSVLFAKKTYPLADYFLLSDADFVWEVGKNTPFEKNKLVASKYLVEQHTVTLSYSNIRLLSSKVDWECLGVTHEYWWECPKQTSYRGTVTSEKLTSLVIDDREDGGYKQHKYIRDEKMLREELTKSSTPPGLVQRYLFYFGQTLKDLGRHAEAIAAYQQRISKGGWPEEIYYSKFQIGYNYERLGWQLNNTLLAMGKAAPTEEEKRDIHVNNPLNLTPAAVAEQIRDHFFAAIVNYFVAYLYRPSRSESLRHIVSLYRQLDIPEMAFLFIDLGKNITYPSNDSLFIEHSTYDYIFDYELAICARNHRKRKEEGRRAYEALCKRKDLPSWIMKTLDQVKRFYS